MKWPAEHHPQHGEVAMFEQMPIGTIAFGIAVVAGLFWIVRALRMPASFGEQEQKRRELRGAMLDREQAEPRETSEKETTEDVEQPRQQ
jgi:hypothetical protein